ncbi:BlaI/MecI/CopY family transcriptional regulator [Glycomyces tenuis]|uniref:BlaI/MecI/CopY family transcriptional regulator n=1 Tax=Glycomyces tenuis TaxID=58116 RepID=UPI000421E8BA|nr:BlaI/MecI/CopY family transcriptional regulator [Glycomyces tenuis]
MRQFGELEAVVMDRLWALGRPATVREVLTGLDRDPVPAYTTVMTIMDNLHRKGVLERHSEGRAWAYRPIHSRAEHDAALMTGVLDASTDRAAALLKFADAIGPAELARLRELMDSDGAERS